MDVASNSSFSHLSGFDSSLLSVFLSSLLIICLHFQTSFGHRDSTQKIKERFWRSLIACVIATCTLCVFERPSSSWEDGKNWLLPSEIGLLPECNAKILLVAVALGSLFAGNFLAKLSEVRYNFSHLVENFKDDYFSSENQILRFSRNFVIAPAVEEYIYRVCLLPVLIPHLGWNAVIIGPALFGIAHFHHGYELLRLGYSLKHVTNHVFVQMLYTTIFGCYCSYLFIVLRNFYLLWAVHSFCNLAGLPDFDMLFDWSSAKSTALLLWIVYLVGLFVFIFINLNYLEPLF